MASEELAIYSDNVKAMVAAARQRWELTEAQQKALAVVAMWVDGDGFQEGADGASAVARLFVPTEAVDFVIEHADGQRSA
jgi:hypothetical protein